LKKKQKQDKHWLMQQQSKEPTREKNLQTLKPQLRRKHRRRKKLKQMLLQRKRQMKKEQRSKKNLLQLNKLKLIRAMY